MLSVLAPIISGVAALLVGLMPSVLVTERRRLLRFIGEESAKLKEVEDPAARSEFAAALLATTKQYRGLAEMTPAERAERVRWMVLPSFCLAVLFGAGLVALGPRDSNHIVLLSLAICVTALVAAAVVIGRSLAATPAKPQGQMQTDAEANHHIRIPDELEKSRAVVEEVRPEEEGSASLPR